MSRVDWDAMVAQLSQQRTAVAQELEDIDAVLATVRERAGSPAAPTKVRKPDTKRENGAKASRASSADTDAAKAQAKKLWERGETVKAIAKTTGRSVGTIYSWSSEGKWKRPNPGVAAPAAAAPVAQPAGTQLSGSVRCTDPDCGVMTDYDPCRRCGKPLKRTKW